ncbi:hypothetical protein [Variovorax sp. GrIS 2.14]
MVGEPDRTFEPACLVEQQLEFGIREHEGPKARLDDVVFRHVVHG